MDGRGLAVVVVLTVTLTGCLGAVEPVAIGQGWDGDPDNHWQKDVLTVSFESPPNDTRDYEPVIHDALVYWTQHSDEYVGFDIGFRRADDGTRGDIHVEFVDTVRECGGVSNTAGCAPILTDESDIDRPASVEVRTGLSRESTAWVLKHELGHTLGLDHGEGPEDVMAAKTELTTLSQPNATERAFTWSEHDFTVYTDVSGVPADQKDAYDRQIEAVLHYYMEGAAGAVPEEVAFYRTSRRETADIVIEAVAEDECRSTSGSCGTIDGADRDGDGAYDEYTHLDVLLVDVESDVVAWHVGRWLGASFGHQQEADYPEPLQQNTTDEVRRSQWWR